MASPFTDPEWLKSMEEDLWQPFEVDESRMRIDSYMRTQLRISRQLSTSKSISTSSNHTRPKKDRPYLHSKCAGILMVTQKKPFTVRFSI
jgi:hypothetical protein